MKEERKETKMNLLSAASIGVGAMIGAGLFALIGIAVEIAGQLAYLAFAAAGVTALLTSYSVSKLAVVFPSKGGIVEYLNRGFGNGIFAGTLNLVMWLGYLIVTSLYAKAFAEYLAALVDVSDKSMWMYLFTSGIVIIFVCINFIGTKAVGSSELLIVVVKVAILLFFGIAGLFTIDSAQMELTTEFSVSKVILASGVVFMSYEGFGLVANTAEDIKNPKINLPKALYLSVIFVALVYILVSIAVIGNLSVDEILKAKEYALAEAAKPIMGRAGFIIMGAAALFSTASAINATIYGPVIMLQQTAQAGQVPSFFIKEMFGHKSGRALIVTGIIILLISNFLDLEEIAETGSLIFLVIYTAVNIANFRLRKITGSNVWIILAGTAGTAFSFAALLYFQIIEENFSFYLFIIIFLTGAIYEYIYKKIYLKNTF